MSEHGREDVELLLQKCIFFLKATKLTLYQYAMLKNRIPWSEYVCKSTDWNRNGLDHEREPLCLEAVSLT